MNILYIAVPLLLVGLFGLAFTLLIMDMVNAPRGGKTKKSPNSTTGELRIRTESGVQIVI